MNQNDQKQQNYYTCQNQSKMGSTVYMTKMTSTNQNDPKKTDMAGKDQNDFK